MNKIGLNTARLNTALLNVAYTNGFPVLSKRSGSSADISQAIMDSLVCWYDPGKQQCTNESMAANPVLADLSGNGHDITCYNFAWSGMSGIGGYIFQPLDKWYKAPSNNGTYTVEGYTLHITKLNTFDNTYYINNTAGKNYVESIEDNTVTTKSFRIRINGLPNGKKVAIGGILPLAAGSEHVNILFPKQHFNSNGEHVVTSVQATIDSENDVWTGNVNYPDILINSDTADDVDITIELLPEYPNALVSDGVDDYCNVTRLPILTKEKGYTVIAKRRYISGTLFSALSSKYVSENTNGAFLFEVKYEHDTDNITNVGSFGALTVVKDYVPNEVSYMTSSSYNNRVDLNQGEKKDGPNLSLFMLRYSSKYMAAALYSFLLFDRTLTTAEIEWAKKNMIESGGVLKTDWSDSSLWAFYNLDNQGRIDGTISSNKMVITSCMATNNFMEVFIENTQTPAYNIKVTGLKNGIVLQYKDGDTATYLYFNEDGIYTIPAHNTNGRWYGFSFNKTFENENIVIQQLLS